MSDIKFGEKLYAIEISQNGVNTILGKRITNLVECKLFDGYHIPYEDERFDIAVISHVIEHVEHPRQLLYEITRVAKFVFIEVPLEDTFRLSHNFVFDEVVHINFYSLKTIRLLLQSCNLLIISEIISDSPKDTYTFKRGRKGLMHYYIKQIELSIFPNIAAKFFCYHGALLCEKNR